MFIFPILIWIFSSVYSKTKYFFIIAGYLSVIILMFLVNCTSILGDVQEKTVKIPYKTFPKKIQAEIKRLNLQDRIFWNEDPDLEENAALVKAGKHRYIIVTGNLSKYGKEEF